MSSSRIPFLGQLKRLVHVLLTALTMSQMTSGTILLHKALVHDMIPPSSSNCSASATNSILYNFTFSPTSASWFNITAVYEDDHFLLEMDNGLDSLTDPRAWKIRLGIGGNLYSFRSLNDKEIIPPQKHENAPFVDEVWQAVAVNTALNNNSDPDSKYFIHQAGMYMGHPDQLPVVSDPFYSPDFCPDDDDGGATETDYFGLFADCVGNGCTVGSWGQQAHVDTEFASSAMYYTRYAHCGDGVLEHTTVIHNAADGLGGVLDYLSTGWFGVRTSTLQDVLMSNPDGTSPAKVIRPRPRFGTNDAVDFDQTGGYSIYAEHLNVPLSEDFLVRCADNEELAVDCCLNVISCCVDDSGNTTSCVGPNAGSPDPEVVSNPESLGAVKLVLKEVYVGYPACAFMQAHTNAYGRYVVRCLLERTVALKEGQHTDPFTLTNNNTLETVNIDGIMHWAWKGDWFYFFLEDGMTVDDINAVLQPGDEMWVALISHGKPYEENLGLSFVHGTSESLDEFYPGGPAGRQFDVDYPSRIRHGFAGDSSRDFTVFGINTFKAIAPGETYIKTQYMIPDELVHLDERSREWVNATRQSHITVDDETSLPGRNVTLFRSRYKMPCGDAAFHLVDCDDPASNGVPVSLRIQSHSWVKFNRKENMEPYYNNRVIIQVFVDPTTRVDTPVWNLPLHIGGTNLTISGVLHWSRHGTTFFFFAGEGLTEVDYNAQLGPGDDIELLETEDLTFGACLEDEDNCTMKDQARVLCHGSTTPKDGTLPVFSVKCGADRHYVGHDRYYFAPEDEDGTLMPYLCDGMPVAVRPEYALLGYFPNGSCADFEHSKYDPLLC